MHKDDLWRVVRLRIISPIEIPHSVSLLLTSCRSDRGEVDNIGSDDDRNGRMKPIQRIDLSKAELIQAIWPPSSLNGMLQHTEKRIFVASEVG